MSLELGTFLVGEPKGKLVGRSCYRVSVFVHGNRACFLVELLDIR